MTSLSELKRGDGRIPFIYKLLGIVLVAFIVQILSINTFPLVFDEGVNLLIPRFIEQGHQPYTEVFVSRSPLFVVFLSTVWTITAGNLFLSKVIFIGSNLILLISLGYLGRRLLGEEVALLGVALLALSAPYTAGALAVSADPLSVTFATLAILATLVYVEDGGRIWLVLAGGFFAIGILIETLVLPLAFVLLLLLLARHSSALRWEGFGIKPDASWKDFPIEMALLLTGSASVLVVALYLFDWGAVYGSITDFRLALRQVIPLSIQNNLQVLLQFSADNVLLFLGMFSGLYFAHNNPKHVVWFLFVWWLIEVLWLMIQTPLLAQNMTLLWVSTVLMASWGFLRLSNRVIGLAKSNLESPGRFPPPFGRGLGGGQSCGELSTLARIGTPLAVVFILVIYAILSVSQVPGLVNRAQDIGDREDFRQFQAIPQAVSFLQTVTSPDDCVISDDPVLSFQAERLPPPALSEPSYARIARGDLSLELITEVVAEQNCKALVVTSHGFEQGMPSITSWAEEFYSQHVNFEGIDIYYQGP